MPHMYSSRFQKHFFLMNTHSHAVTFSQNLFTNVIKIAHIRPLNIKTLIYNTQKVLILIQENHHPNLITTYNRP